MVWWQWPHAIAGVTLQDNPRTVKNCKQWRVHEQYACQLSCFKHAYEAQHCRQWGCRRTTALYARTGDQRKSVFIALLCVSQNELDEDKYLSRFSASVELDVRRHLCARTYYKQHRSLYDVKPQLGLILAPWLQRTIFTFRYSVSLKEKKKRSKSQKLYVPC